MTLLGKIMVFLFLILAIGVAVYSTSVYANRPPWYDDFKDVGGYDKGNTPMTFKQLGDDIDAQSKAALLAGANWGKQLQAVQSAETTRSSRHVQMFGTPPPGYPPAAAVK